jgi:hypothetical protein
MAKKNRLSLPWRLTGYVFKGIGLGVWYTLKGAGKAIGWGVKKTATKMKESSEKRKLNRNPIYGKKAMFEPLEVLNQVSGDYAVSEQRIHDDSIIALIFGKRGSGKSALGFRLLENIHNKAGRRCFVLGVDERSSMPEWISPIENIDDAPKGSVVLVDEGAVSFNARESMSKANKGLAGILAIARHKNLTVLFITQNTGMIDRNVLKLSDMLLVKQGSLLQLEMERPEIRKFYEKAESLFKKLEGDKRQYVYVIDSDFEGAVSHSLPSFWTETLSKNQAEEHK